MDFFQELVLTAFLAFIFSFVIVKFVSLAFSDADDYGKTAIFSVEEVKLGSGLKVGSTKSKKRVKFADDVMVRKIDQFQGEKRFESHGLCLNESVGEEEKTAKRVHQFEGEELEKDSEFKISGTVDLDKGSENIGMLIEEINQKDESVDDDEDDDWEGIERSDLEKVFAEAVNYVEYGGKGKEKDNDHLPKLPSNVQLQLYGLHKVALEGPCHEPQPMALKVSSRAKWNAWQRLGRMNQEAAMEQYIKILSDSVPEWMKHYSADDDLLGSASGFMDSQLRSLPKDERKEKLNIVTDVSDSGMDANSTEKDKNE